MQKAVWFINETLVDGREEVGRWLRAAVLRIVSGSLGDLQAATRRERAKFELLQRARAEGLRRAEAAGRSRQAAVKELA